MGALFSPEILQAGAVKGLISDSLRAGWRAFGGGEEASEPGLQLAAKSKQQCQINNQFVSLTQASLCQPTALPS